MRALPLTLLVAFLVGCPSTGPQGPTGPKGDPGTKGADGASGAPALTRATSIAPGADCAAGGVRLESGPDTNGNGTLDSGEVTVSSNLCNGETGTQGPAGPASAWELTAADGFVFGRPTGFAGWLWNDTEQGFLPQPAGAGRDVAIVGPMALRVFFGSPRCTVIQGTGTAVAYVDPATLGSVVPIKDMIVPLPHYDIQSDTFDPTRVDLFRPDWTTSDSAALMAYRQPSTGTCTTMTSVTPSNLVLLVPLHPQSGTSQLPGQPATHTGPATLTPVTVP